MFHNLRKIRLERKMTLKYVSEKLTIAESTLSKIETGQQGLLSDIAIQLANLYKVSLDELLSREWHNPETTVFKTVDFELNDILRKLKTYTNNELTKLTLHSLRHYFATQCLNAGIAEKVTTAWLGHHDSKVAKEIYQHIKSDFEDEQIKKLAKYRQVKK